MMQRPNSSQLLVAAFGALLGVTALQTVWPCPWIPPRLLSLAGATVPAAAPRWTWKGILDGSAMRACERWFDDRVGFRSLWVRLDNQVNYTVFRQAPLRKEGSQIIIGKDGSLFERKYVEGALKPATGDHAKADALARRVRSVQDKIEGRGIPFLLVIAPSKAEVYPEQIPTAWLRGRQPSEIETDYERAVERLKAAGVRLYDGPARFAAWKAAGRAHLFPQPGAHWSYDAGVTVLQEIRELLNPRMKRPMPELTVQSSSVAPARSTDRDLLRLLNIYLDVPRLAPLPFPAVAAKPALPVDRLPRILWVNDSFGWTLVDLVYAAGAARPSESLYYFATCKQIPDYTDSTRDVNSLDWPAYLSEFDAVVVLWTQLATDSGELAKDSGELAKKSGELAKKSVGWGFFESVEKGLDQVGR